MAVKERLLRGCGGGCRRFTNRRYSLPRTQYGQESIRPILTNPPILRILILTTTLDTSVPVSV